VRKSLFIFFISLIFYQTAAAQKQDTLRFYMKDDVYIRTPDSADSFVLVLPADSSSGQVIYPVYGFYRNGNRKSIAYSTSKYFKNNTSFEGPYTTFFSNGKRASVDHYMHGMLYGNLIKYYPNGKIYSIEAHDTVKNELMLIECRDTTGKLLTVNGKGNWIKYNPDFTKIVETGFVSDSLQNGEWYGVTDNAFKYYAMYKHGQLLFSSKPDNSKTDVNSNGSAATEVQARFKNGGYQGFVNYILRAIVYPKDVIIDKTNAKIIIRFTVEEDGSIVDVRMIKGIESELSVATINAILLSPKWSPQISNGIPVKSYFSFPFDFPTTDR